MAKVQQDIMASGEKTSIRLAELTDDGTTVTAVTRAAPFDVDILAAVTRDKTLAAEADTEYSDQELVDTEIAYRVTKVQRYIKPVDGEDLPTTDEQDTIAFEVAGTTIQEKALLAYKKNKTNLLIAYSAPNNISTNAPDHFVMFVCRITEVNEAKNDKHTNVTFTVEGVSDLTTALLFSDINTSMGFATDKFFSPGDDDATDGVTCTGLADAGDVTDIFTGSIQLIDQ